jgi:hypothetical protein
VARHILDEKDTEAFKIKLIIKSKIYIKNLKSIFNKAYIAYYNAIVFIKNKLDLSEM